MMNNSISINTKEKIFIKTQDGVDVSAIWLSIPKGFAGLAIQWIAIPIFSKICYVAKKNDR